MEINVETCLISCISSAFQFCIVIWGLHLIFPITKLEAQ